MGVFCYYSLDDFLQTLIKAYIANLRVLRTTLLRKFQQVPTTYRRKKNKKLSGNYYKIFPLSVSKI